jgi:hypothetical protein
MSTEQKTSQIKVIEQLIPKKITKINYKKKYIKEKEKNNNLEVKLEQIINELDDLKLEIKKLSKCSLVKQELLIEDTITEKNLFNKKCFNDEEFWEGLIMLDLNLLKSPIEYLLEQFGTKEPCNRFDYIKSCGFKVLELPNAKRFDIDIHNYKKLSIKYSSTGDITLHNSNSSINKDIDMKDTILLTPDKLYLITKTELCKNNININDYIKNTGDSLKLKRIILKELKKKKYPYIYDINIKHNKIECKNRLCSKIFYYKFKEEYKSSLK